MRVVSILSANECFSQNHCYNFVGQSGDNKGGYYKDNGGCCTDRGNDYLACDNKADDRDNAQDTKHPEFSVTSLSFCLHSRDK